MQNIFQNFYYLGEAQASYILQGRPNDFNSICSVISMLVPNDVECVVFCQCLIGAFS